MTEFPFPYSIRKSKRSKRLGLKVSPEHGVQLVVPERMSEVKALQFLHEHRAWVEKHIHVWKPKTDLVLPPETIELVALQQTWGVTYEHNHFSRRTQIIERADRSLVYFGREDDAHKMEKLTEWVEKKAAHYLSERLLHWSRETKLEFAQLNFRSQKTLWGSCTRNKNISLNNRLIFFAEPLVDYVLVHELCHTKQMNHGVKFWRLVSDFVPDYLERRAALNKAKHLIPRWVG